MPKQQKLADLSGRHAAHLHRYSSYTVNKIYKILDRVDSRLTLQISEILQDMTPKEIASFIKGSYSTRRLIKLRDNIQEMAGEARKVTSQIIGNSGKDLASYEVGHAMKIAGVVGVAALGTEVSVSQAYAAAMSRPMNGRHIRDHIRDIEPKFRKELFSKIREGFLIGEATASIVRRIRGTVEQKRKDGLIFKQRRGIESLVRTSMTHISSVASNESYKALGVKRVKWVSTLDGRTSHVCATLDGKVFDIDKGQRPPAHINCRSTIVPHVKGSKGYRPYVSVDKDGKKKIGRVKNSTNFDQWFKNQPKSFKKEWLGGSRYKLYKEGGIDLPRFSDPAGKLYTLDRLKELDSQAFKDAGLAV